YGNPIHFSELSKDQIPPADAESAELPGYDVLFERAPFPMWICDAESLRLVAVNLATLKRYGWSREEFLAMTMDKVLPTSDVAAFIDHRRQVESRGAGMNQ